MSTLPRKCQICTKPAEHDVARCTQHLYSGFNKLWTESLGDMEPQECRDFMAKIAEAPAKRCDALLGCDKSAEWYVNFHGCENVCTCDEHREIWVNEIHTALVDQGQIPCVGCGKSFTSLSKVMTWRRI